DAKTDLPLTRRLRRGCRDVAEQWTRDVGVRIGEIPPIEQVEDVDVHRRRPASRSEYLCNAQIFVPVSESSEFFEPPRAGAERAVGRAREGPRIEVEIGRSGWMRRIEPGAVERRRDTDIRVAVHVYRVEPAGVLVSRANRQRQPGLIANHGADSPAAHGCSPESRSIGKKLAPRPERQRPAYEPLEDMRAIGSADDGGFFSQLRHVLNRAR